MGRRKKSPRSLHQVGRFEAWAGQEGKVVEIRDRDSIVVVKAMPCPEGQDLGAFVVAEVVQAMWQIHAKSLGYLEALRVNDFWTPWNNGAATWTGLARIGDEWSRMALWVPDPTEPCPQPEIRSGGAWLPGLAVVYSQEDGWTPPRVAPWVLQNLQPTDGCPALDPECVEQAVRAWRNRI